MFRPLSLIGTLLLCAVPAFGASISVTFNPFTLTGIPGDELTYEGTIAATSEVYLNGICFSFTAAACDKDNSPGLDYFTIDTDPFYENQPGFYFDCDEFTTPVFGATIDPNTPAGSYSGTVTLLGGADMYAFDPQGSGTFELVVTAPEPATVSFLLLGMGVLALLNRRGEFR
jgi:hypothetical protein